MKKLLVFAAATMLASAGNATSTDDADDIPRTPSGKPDFSGTYDIKTMTPMDRPRRFGDNKFMNREEAERISERVKAGNQANDNRVLNANREAPPEGGDGSPGAAGNVGGYNRFWIDNGDEYSEVDGQFRTSIVYYPDNGRRPQMTAEAYRRIAQFRNFFRKNEGKAWWLETGGRGPADDPEILTKADRCLQGFGSTGGPPMLPVLYNNVKRIVQSEDTLMILIEMVHDARIIRIGGEHLPDDVRKWYGDSIGWWEGDTLVVETTNFNDTPALGLATRNLKVTERFSMIDHDAMLYNFTVEDPTVWQDKWSGEYPWPKTEHSIYEYACHEGNYAMGNILRGARRLERDYMAAQGNSQEEEGE